MNPVTLTHLLAQTRSAEIARAAERAAQFEPATRPGHQPRWAGLTHRWARATHPATGSATGPATVASPCSPVACCA